MAQFKENMKCPGVKRLMREAAELAQPTEHYHAAPLEENLFEWHFTVRGQEGTSFEGGIYHGRITFPLDYPLKPPSVMLLTPNGRFEINRKICLSISDHHPETWQPSWSIRTVLLAIVGFMPTPGKGAIGALDWSDVERKKLARKSNSWVCSSCGSVNATALLPPTETTKSDKDKFAEEAKKYAAELSFKAEKEKSSTTESEEAGASSEQVAAEPEAAPVAEPAQAAPVEAAVVVAPVVTPVPVVQSSQGSVCTLLMVYFLIMCIGLLFVRRAARTMYNELFYTEL